MGFGLLFVGYLITYVGALNTYGVVFRLVGYIMMAYALLKLSAYERRFKLAGYASGILAVMSALGTAELIVTFLHNNLMISSNPFTATYSTVMLYVEAAGVFAYQILLLLAIRAIAKTTEVRKIELNTGRNIFFVAVYYVVYLIGRLPLPIKEAYERNMGLPLLVLYLAWIILQILLLFSCYVNICDENDLEMERKKSRFEFVNKFRAELDEKQARARESAEQYRREKAEKRRNRKK